MLIAKNLLTREASYKVFGTHSQALQFGCAETGLNLQERSLSDSCVSPRCAKWGTDRCGAPAKLFSRAILRPRATRSDACQADRSHWDQLRKAQDGHRR